MQFDVRYSSAFKISTALNLIPIESCCKPVVLGAHVEEKQS